MARRVEHARALGRGDRARPVLRRSIAGFAGTGMAGVDRAGRAGAAASSS